MEGTRAAFIAASRSPRVRAILVMAALVGLLVGVDTAVLHLRLDPLTDVHAYYEAGARLNAGVPLYSQPASTNESEFYRYPPLLAILFRPLATFPFEVASAIWAGLQVAALAATVWLLGVRKLWTWLALGWLAAPILWTLTIGQAHMLVTLLLTVASPFTVAVAGHLKVFPALAAVYWLGRRDWRRLALFIGWIVALAFVSFALEPSGTIAYLTFLSLEQVGEVRNLSLYAQSPLLWVGSVVVLTVVALWLAPTRLGWAAAVLLTVFVTPRLLMYQFVSILAAFRDPGTPRAPHQDPVRSWNDGLGKARLRSGPSVLLRQLPGRSNEGD